MNRIFNIHIESGYDLSVFDEKPHFEFLQVKQVHGNKLVSCQEANNLIEADGIVCTCQKCTLAIKTADCVPIFVIGENGHANIHAGWRGVHNKIIHHNLLEKIIPRFFYMGPHILQNQYQVGPEFESHFKEYCQIAKNSDNFLRKNGDHFYISLQNILKKQITEKYPKSTILLSEECTFLDHKYHSFRRDQTDKRNWNIIKPVKG